MSFAHTLIKRAKMENFKSIEDRLRNIETLLKSQKAVLNFDEVADYTGLSKSYLYKLTCSAVLVGVIGAGSGIGVVVPVVIGTTTWIVSLSKDYKANNLLKSTGLLLQ